MHRLSNSETEAASLDTPTYARRYFTGPVPKDALAEEPMPAEAAYRLVRDELVLDGNPALNLATFVSTWMEPQADRLAAETLNKNLVDKDEYPQTNVIEERCSSMLARLWNAPADCMPVGTSTIGSSEGIMLGLLAHKRRWRNRREAAGLDADRPNMVMSAAVHTCWEKAATYFEIEPRVVPLAPRRTTLRAEHVEPLLDERTIAVGAVLGNTFTGGVDEIEAIDALLRRVGEERGLDIPIHVDAASGGFVAPFVAPDVAWDFRLERVRSINASNHKFGLVYPGMGSVVFRDQSDVPEELVFHITYLGGDSPTYSLNFSQGSGRVVLQYYNFLRLGRSGYERVMKAVTENARELQRRLEALDVFELLDTDSFMPVLSMRLRDGAGFSVFDLSERLRERGWIVPAYPLPADLGDVSVLRMVVKESFSRDKSDLLLDALRAAIDKLGGRRPEPPPAGIRAPRPIC